MKKRLQMGIWTVLALSLLGTVLRFLLMSSGLDEKGLPVLSHPGVWLCYVLTALMIAAVAAAVLPITVKPRCRRNFPASAAAAAGCAAAALGLGVFGCQVLSAAGDTLTKISGIAAFLATAAMLGTAFFRIKGMRAHIVLGIVVCLFFMLLLYCRYRQWSREPQLSLYFYAMLATVCAMIACYYRTALDAGAGSIRAFLGFSLAALFFCCLAIPGSGEPALYLGFGLYFAGELTAIRLPKRAKAEPKQET